MFRVGQKVVCVNAAGFESFIARGSVYQIRSINIEFGQIWLRLAEIAPRVDQAGFCSTRFRPLVERKTDISIFKAMLTPAGKKEPINVR